MTLRSGLSILITAFSLTFATKASGQWVQTNGPNRVGITSLAVNGTYIFAGTNGSSVFISTDNGSNWKMANSSLTDTFINTLAMRGTNLFAGTAGDYGINTGGNVFLSTDSGTNWTAESKGWTNTDVNALAVSDSNLFAATWNGVFVLTDIGASWVSVNAGLPYDDAGPGDAGDIVALAVNGTNIFAASGFAEYNRGDVFLLTNDSSSWTDESFGMPANDPVNALAISDMNIFAGTNGGVFLTTNNGMVWTSVSAGLGTDSNRVIAFAVSGTNLFAGSSGGGVFLTTDSGSSWHTINAGLTDSVINSLVVSGTYLFAGTDSTGVWRCPLSEIISSSGVAQTQPISPEIQSYPNPFSQSTTINFSLQESGVAEVTIVNLLGQQVARLFDGEMEAGEHSFEWNANGFASGMYECVVRVDGSLQRVPIIHY